MRWLGAVLGCLILAGCAGSEGDEVAVAPSSTTLTSTTLTTSTSTTTTTVPTTTTTTMPTTTTTIDPIVATLAGSWRARSPNAQVDGWADLHLTDTGFFRFTNPQADDMELATGAFVFEDDTVTVFFGHVVWQRCDDGSVFTWELEDEDTLRFTEVEDECSNIVRSMTTHPWKRQS